LRVKSEGVRGWSLGLRVKSIDFGV